MNNDDAMNSNEITGNDNLAIAGDNNVMAAGNISINELPCKIILLLLDIITRLMDRKEVGNG